LPGIGELNVTSSETKLPIIVEIESEPSSLVVEAEAMSKDSSVTMVFILGGIVCILVSVAAVTYFYHQHAAEFVTSNDKLPITVLPFTLFVGVPSVAVFVVGAILLAMGIKRDKSS
jgi:hypothetical protein